MPRITFKKRKKSFKTREVSFLKNVLAETVVRIFFNFLLKELNLYQKDPFFSGFVS